MKENSVFKITHVLVPSKCDTYANSKRCYFMRFMNNREVACLEKNILEMVLQNVYNMCQQLGGFGEAQVRISQVLASRQPRGLGSPFLPDDILAAAPSLFQASSCHGVAGLLGRHIRDRDMRWDTC